MEKMRFAEKDAFTLMVGRFIVLLQIIMSAYLATEAVKCNDDNAKTWTPPWSEDRNDLYCYNACFDERTEENCCSCNSCTTWMGKEIDLYIEDLSITGQNIVLSNNHSVESNVYKISRSHSEMKEFPVNLCKDINIPALGTLFNFFSNISSYRERIVLINFEFNEIVTIGDLSCLYKLDELNLRYNSISYLSNTSFINLSYLRTLRLEGNKLSTLDPNTLSSKNLHILNVDISGNLLETLDVSNIVLPYQFCEINVASNDINKFVNLAGFELNENQIYGPGYLNLQGNSIKEFPDLKTLLNIDNLSRLGKVWDFGFDLRGIPIICDCTLQPFLSLAKDIIEALWRDYFEVKCTAPESLYGETIPNLNLSDLVCSLDAESGCQSPECTCFDEPNKDTLFIDCSNAVPSLQYFPSIPNSRYSSKISLNLSGNAIKYIPDESYLSKLSNLDLSGNDIREINDSIAGQLEQAVIDLTKNHRLLRLPQTFQYWNACSIILGDVTIDCDCDSQWIAEWLKSKACKNEHFYCKVPGKGFLPASLFNVDDIDCYELNILFRIISIITGGITALFLVTVILLYIFRYEVLIIYFRMRSNRTKKSMIQPTFLFDVYIALNEDNDDSRAWVNKHLDTYLTNLGYKVFIPYRDIHFGAVRADQAINAIEQSRSVLVILTKNHFKADSDERPLTENEWSYAWNSVKKHKCKSIVLVNFDHISAGDIKHAQIKAFLRVGSCVDFRNHDRDIMSQIRVELGEPQVRPCADGEQARKFIQKDSDHSLSIVDIELH